MRHALAGHFILGGAHSLANFTLRLLLLNDKAAANLNRRRPKAAGFPPGSDDHRGWLTFNEPMVELLTEAADESGNRHMVKAVATVRAFYQGRPFKELEHRRGLDYHRRRPQSVEHVSPRAEVMKRSANEIQFSMPAPTLEPEADADKIHQIVVTALDSLQGAMAEVRRLLPQAIKEEGVTYIFPQ